MSKKFNWMPILKTGTFTAKNGKQVEIDENKLDLIIAGTDLSTEPQFVIEHPQYDKLGFGTIERLKRVGKYLFALPKKVDEKFKEIVNKGELPGRSVCLDENTLALSSIGFLPPSILPAVDGLGSYEFANQHNNSAGKENSIEFSFDNAEQQFMEEDGNQPEPYQNTVLEQSLASIKNIFINIKNTYTEKLGKDEAERIIPENELQSIGNTSSAIENSSASDSVNTEERNSNTASSVNSNNKAKIDFSSVDTSRMDLQLKLALETLINENKQLETNLVTAKTELQTATQTILDSSHSQNRKEVLAFCQSEEMKLKILPSEVEKVSALLLAVKENGTLEFSTGENLSAKIQLNAYDYLKEILKQIPNKIELSEIATHQNAGSLNVTEYQKVGSEIAGFVNHKK